MKFRRRVTSSVDGQITIGYVAKPDRSKSKDALLEEGIR